MYHHDQYSWMDSAHPDALLASGGAFLPLISHQQEIQQSQSTFRRSAMTLIREEEVVELSPPPARYSAEERRERIDKYQSKRNHRNFQKKITYACRKTLADSRPRVKGRFARGCGEDYADPEAQVVLQEAGMSESPPVNDVVTGNGSDSTSMPEWWQEALATGVDDMDNLYDEDMLAAYLGVSSISLYSPSAYSPSASGQ